MRVQLHPSSRRIEIYVFSRIGFWIAHRIQTIIDDVLFVLSALLFLNYLFALSIGWLGVLTLAAAFLNAVGVETLNPGGFDPSHEYVVIGVNTNDSGG